MLCRNDPRSFRYQFFSTLPRGGNCFICRANTLHGLEPCRRRTPRCRALRQRDRYGGPSSQLGTPLRRPVEAHIGADVKWTPNADNALDLTVKPDFSQVESDTAQISANERFALLLSGEASVLSRRRESVLDADSGDVHAPHHRARVGRAAHRQNGGREYTMLVADDAGGGSAIIPGPTASTLVAQDTPSTVVVAGSRRICGSRSSGWC